MGFGWGEYSFSAIQSVCSSRVFGHIQVVSERSDLYHVGELRMDLKSRFDLRILGVIQSILTSLILVTGVRDEGKLRT